MCIPPSPVTWIGVEPAKPVVVMWLIVASVVVVVVVDAAGVVANALEFVVKLTDVSDQLPKL